MRTKYTDKPERFVDSEIDLDEDIKTLSSLSAYPELFRYFA
jgi:beta-catenin-like protein 1